MPILPTLIVLADPAAPARHMAYPASDESGHDTSGDRILNDLDTLRHVLDKGLASGLNVVLVAPEHFIRPTAAVHPAVQVVGLPRRPAPDIPRADLLTLGLASAVMASAQSPGWLLLPADMPMLQEDTLSTLAQALLQYPLVIPEYRDHPGQPIGFSAEFYSELINLKRERDLLRLISRYPAKAVPVNDPGILMSLHAPLFASSRPTPPAPGGRPSASRPS